MSLTNFYSMNENFDEWLGKRSKTSAEDQRLVSNTKQYLSYNSMPGDTKDLDMFYKCREWLENCEPQKREGYYFSFMINNSYGSSPVYSIFQNDEYKGLFPS